MYGAFSIAASGVISPLASQNAHLSAEMVLKTAHSAASENSSNFDILHVVILDIILSKERIIKTLTSLRVCAGWCAPLLLACNSPRDQYFMDDAQFSWCSSMFTFGMLKCSERCVISVSINYSWH